MNPLRYFLLSALCVVALAGPAPALAQSRLGQRQGGRLNQLENAKIAFLTARLTLTQEQAVRFWPLYNEFSSKRRELNRSARLLRRGASTAGLTDAQLRDDFTQEFAVRQQQLNLEKEYFDKMQKVLTLQQLAQLYQAERDFTKEVLRRVADRGGAAGNED